MTMFDSIIAEANERFNLGDKAGMLLSALLALMTDGNRGGLAGFTDKFNQAGFGDAASSWISSGVNAEVSNEQLETALGKDALDGISNQIGTDYSNTVSAAAFMTPRIVNALTPDGVVPPDSDLLTRVGGFLTNPTGAPTVAETFDRVGTAAAPVLDEEKKNTANVNMIDGVASPIDDRSGNALSNVGEIYDDKNNSPLGWLLPLLLLGLLIILGYMFCSKPPPPPTPTTTNTNANRVITNSVNQ